MLEKFSSKVENLTELTIGGMRNIKDDSRLALVYMTT